MKTLEFPPDFEFSPEHRELISTRLRVFLGEDAEKICSYLSRLSYFKCEKGQGMSRDYWLSILRDNEVRCDDWKSLMTIMNCLVEVGILQVYEKPHWGRATIWGPGSMSRNYLPRMSREPEMSIDQAKEKLLVVELSRSARQRHIHLRDEAENRVCLSLEYRIAVCRAEQAALELEIATSEGRDGKEIEAFELKLDRAFADAFSAKEKVLAHERETNSLWSKVDKVVAEKWERRNAKKMACG